VCHLNFVSLRIFYVESKIEWICHNILYTNISRDDERWTITMHPRVPRGHRCHRRFMDICGLPPSNDTMMYYLYAPAYTIVVVVFVVVNLAHNRWESSRALARMQATACARRHLEKSPLNFWRRLPAIPSISVSVVTDEYTYIRETATRRIERWYFILYTYREITRNFLRIK